MKKPRSIPAPVADVDPRRAWLRLACLACGNFHRVAREWMYGDAPQTELGREEAAFWTPTR